MVRPRLTLLTYTHERKVKREAEAGLTLEAPQTPGLAPGLPCDWFLLPPSKLLLRCHPATSVIPALSLRAKTATFVAYAPSFHGYHLARNDPDSALSPGPSTALHGDHVFPQILEHMEECTSDF